jgi:hypothetical protein
VAQLELSACALERFHLARGHYPDSLSELYPAFLQKETRDPINGEPLRYHSKSNDHFILYSVGWNEKDDNGTAFNNQGGTVDTEDSDGDWVWEG